MNRKRAEGPAPTPTASRGAAAQPPHPRSVPILAEEGAETGMPEQPFQEGAHDIVDPDLRHRMISEVAFGLYAERGFADGSDVEDWLAAEQQVDHLLLRRAATEPGEAPAPRKRSRSGARTSRKQQ